MGCYLNGSTRDMPTLPLLGKAACLVTHYGAQEVDRWYWDKLSSYGEIPAGKALVIVIVVCNAGAFDAALFVDEFEFGALKNAPKDALHVPGKPEPRFLLMDKAIVIELADFCTRVRPMPPRV